MGEDKIKGYLFNVIIYTHEKHRSEYFKHIVSTFIENYPCRVIFIQSENTLESAPATELPNAACDKIQIQSSLSTLDQVPFKVLPLIIPDLPIYLVWGQNPVSDNVILPTLLKLATRFVYDSDCAKDLQEFSVKMLKKSGELRIDFMDVGWAYISGWRDVIAQTFNSPEKLAYVNSCDEITINYNSFEDSLTLHPARQALYLQAWLAAQMEWSYQSITNEDGSVVIKYQTPNTITQVILKHQKRPKLSQGRIFEVAFHDRKENTTTLSLAEKQEKVMIYFSTPQKCELPFSFPIPDMEKGMNAMNEIFYNRVSDHYKNMLHVLSQIPNQGL